MEPNMPLKKPLLGPFAYTVIGFLVGLFGGGLVFYNLDTTRGWNPFGWWLIATFVAMVLGGISGLLIYGIRSKKAKEHKS